ncbi:hypothetical protein SLA2020_068860 [Shorea laevis]
MADLPGDIIQEILYRLPVKSLMRFQCVCKSWQVLIKNPDFVSKHLSLAITDKTQHHVIVSAENRKRHSLSWVSYEEETGSYVCKVIEEGSTASYQSYLGVLDHCNGIICLAVDDDVVLLNPGIRQSRRLPETCIRSSDGDWDRDYFTCSVGFGYDPRSSDYKVVRIWNSNVDDHVRIEVYTMSSNSWREIFSFVEYFADYFVWGTERKRYLNGSCYWLGQEEYYSEDEPDSDEEGNDSEIIVSFDMSNEVFQKISTPDDFHSRGFYNNGLHILKGSLSLVQCPWLAFQEKLLKVWVRNESGVNGVWTQLKTVRLFPIARTPLLFWKDDDILVKCNNWKDLVSYNVGTQHIDDIPIFAEVINVGVSCNIRCAETYVCSLVSVWGN